MKSSAPRNEFVLDFLDFLKVELLCYGAKSRGLYRGRKGGAGPAGGRCLVMPDGDVLDVPMRGEFIKDSPFELREHNRGWMLYKRQKPLIRVSMLPLPRFYNKMTSDGIPMRKVAKLHGRDCLATTLFSKCLRWRQGKPCKFCAIEVYAEKKPLIMKTGEQLAEVAVEAVKEGVAKHMTITTGTTPGPDRGAILLSSAVHKIKEKVNIPIHVQLEPPENLRYLDLLKESGVDTVGIHIETFDETVRKEVCPGRAEISLNEYIEAWSYAVDLFGKAQVSSFLIVGLGESDESILRGAETLAKLGVFPHVVPLRPIPGSQLAHLKPPDPKRLFKIYLEVGKILAIHGISRDQAKGGCTRCRACGLGLTHNSSA